MSGFARWTVCPCCGAAAELLAVYPRCTSPGCRWHDPRAEELYAEECPTPVPWRSWVRPEEGVA